MTPSPAPEPPTLSVIIATYNRRDLLRVNLEALARQTYPFDRFEVLVVSDGSTDDTHAMVAEYARIAPYRLHLITQANAGPSRARNRGVQEAAGRVAVFVDDDLEPLPEFLAAHAAHHEAETDRVVVGPIIQDPQRRWVEPPWLAWEHAMLAKRYRNFRLGTGEPPGWGHFAAGNVSVGCEHVLAVGGFDEAMRRQEDIELGFRLQRDRRLHFLFEEAAVGMHRSDRSLASWLNVPYEYGQLDVACARRGDMPWEKVWDGYHGRSRITRLLASLCCACPPAAAPLQKLLLAGAQVSFRLHQERIAIGALSILYNLLYLEGARSAIGDRSLGCLIRRDPTPVRG